MKCTKARRLFSSYLDGAATGAEMHALSSHLLECPDCQQQYRALEKTRSVVASVGRRQPPTDLALKIRVAISRERSQGFRGRWQSFLVRTENALNAFMFPATAGLVAAIFMFGLMIGAFVPAGAQRSNDLPSGFYTPPRLEPSEYSNALLNLASPVVIAVDVDADGRVQDYNLVSGSDDEETRQQLNRALLFSKFVPAQAFGRRVPGRVVISFSQVSVGG
jgi:anti-sigma factor RsiW